MPLNIFSAGGGNADDKSVGGGTGIVPYGLMQLEHFWLKMIP